jgi:hypothetical protein
MALRIGFGQYDVTPPLGVALCGYDKRQGMADGLHDPLRALAMVFDDGTTTAALIVADVIAITPEQYVQVGRLVEQWTGIPAGHVIAAGTHTHSGPAPRPARPRPGNLSANELCSRLLPDLMASAARLAWGNRRVASLIASCVRTGRLTINRREPDGPVDHELTVVHVQRRGASSGMLLSYACHGVVMGPDNLAISADWIGLTRAALNAADSGLFAMVAVAPSGDINPLPASIRRRIREKGVAYFTNDPFSGIYDRTGGTFAEAQAMGRSLARAALRAADTRSHARHGTATRAGHRLADFGQRNRTSAAGSLIRVASRSVDIGTEGKPLRAGIRVIRIGELALVGMAGEQFVDTGLEMKRAVRAFGLTPVVIAHAPHLAYVPTAAAFAQVREQDYEVVWARKLGMASDAADRELAALRQALRAVTREPARNPVQAPRGLEDRS